MELQYSWVCTSVSVLIGILNVLNTETSSTYLEFRDCAKSAQLGDVREILRIPRKTREIQ